MKQLFHDRFLTNSSLNDIPKESLAIVYHKSCYMSYTSEHNIVVFTSRQTDEVAAGPSKDVGSKVSKGCMLLCIHALN
jgi:hypothetical protein